MSVPALHSGTRPFTLPVAGVRPVKPNTNGLTMRSEQFGTLVGNVTGVPTAILTLKDKKLGQDA